MAWLENPIVATYKIETESGTVLTRRSNLKFTGNVSATDDSTNDKTIVNILSGVIPVNPTDTTGLNIWIEDDTQNGGGE